MSAKSKDLRPAWVDPDDAPEITDAWIEEADRYEGERRVQRGRPPCSNRKQSLTVRYDADVIAAFKATGSGWQTRMNDALREWLSSRRAA